MLAASETANGSGKKNQLDSKRRSLPGTPIEDEQLDKVNDVQTLRRAELTLYIQHVVPDSC